jgi:RNA polymerase sigma-70 factor (ECF subfamily)
MVENFHSFRGTEIQFRNWLYRIATNAVNQHLRKIARRNNLMKSAGEQTNGWLPDCEESSRKLALLKEAMLVLKPRYQTIITLRFFENLKLKEIAEVLASNPGTVRSQLARALARLRKQFFVGLKDETGVNENEQ